MISNNFVCRNGGGLIVGPEALVGSDCHVSKDSRVEGESALSFQSSLTDSSIKDSHVVLADIRHSAVIRSHVAGALISNSALDGVCVRGCGDTKAVVQDSLLSNEVVVEACTVRGVELSGSFLLHRDWNHTPRHRLLKTENGIQQGLCECSEDNDSFHTGCVCRPWATWDKRESLLRRYFVEKGGWFPEDFDGIRATFALWRSQR